MKGLTTHTGWNYRLKGGHFEVIQKLGIGVVSLSDGCLQTGFHSVAQVGLDLTAQDAV